MKNFISYIFLCFLLAIKTYASHVPGGNITYECVGPNQYLVTLTLFEDCGTAFESNFPQTIQAQNTCGLTNPTISLPNIIFQQEVSQLCPAQIGQSECNGGNLPGVWMHQWQAVVTLPGPCDTWTFSYSSCCRNNSVNVTGQPSYYWETTLNSVTSPCNSSAQITSQPIPYVCINQPVNFNMAAMDPNGNTLQYSLVPALTTGPGMPVTYNGGYSGTSPIPGVSINPSTGQITFTPTMLGNYVFAVLITEYDANGNVVGTVMQDFQFEVINCVNQVPNNPVGGAVITSGNVSITGGNTIQACMGDSFCFSVTFTDNDPNNVLQVTHNVNQIFPGATVTVTGTNPATANVCITIGAGSPSASVLSFDVEDNACPIPGINSFPVLINVINSTYAGPDVIMCLGQGVQLNATGGSNFQWSVISGPPMQIGTNFSCNPCQNPIANPASTTVYQVVSNLGGGCSNIDTIVVTVVPDFTYNLTQSTTSTCLLNPIQFNITTNPAGTYTYNWAPATGLSCTNCPNPTGNYTTPGTYNYTVTMTSPQGCVHTTQTSVVIAPAYNPQPTATATPNTIVCGNSSQLDVTLAGGVPANCGPSLTGGCNGPTSQITQGNQTGANTQYTYPAPYGNWYANEKHQFLFTAAELQASGFIGGKISQIGWQITQLGGLITYPGYTIKMGCTNATQLTTNFITGLTTVYGPQNTTVAMGWNMHTLTTPYEWDGISNLVVEICYNWVNQYQYTTNCISPWTTTGFTSAAWFNSDGTPACPSASGFGTSNNRPITRFTTCPSTPNPANYTYSWTPGATLNNPNIQSPVATPTSTTTYTVTVTDISAGCTGTAQVTVVTDCPTCNPALPAITNVTCNGGNNGSITATTQGVAPPYTMNWYQMPANTLIQTNNNLNQGDAITLTNLTAGCYKIELIDATNCVKDTTVCLTEPPVVTVTASNDTIICINGTAVISATAQGGSGSGYVYTWDNALPQGQTQNVTPATNTCYNVTAIDGNGCASTNSDQVCVTLNPPLSVTTSGDQTVCVGASANISATGQGGSVTGYTYVWTLNGNPVGNGQQISVTAPANGSQYCVTLTDNCTTPATQACLTINFNQTPHTLSTSGNATVCPGSSISISANAQGGGGTGFTYTWTENGNPAGTSANTTVTPPADGTVYCVTSTDNCTQLTQQECLTINYNPIPQVTFTVDNNAGCYPVNSTFTNTTDPNLVSNVVWQFGNNATANTNPTASYSYTVPGCYDVTLTVTTPAGCITSATVPDMVCAYPYPDADFTFGPQPTDFFNSTINFTNTSSTDVVSSLWNFSGLGTSTQMHPSFTFPQDEPGTYPVQLIVTNQYGCNDTTIQEVIINGIYVIYAPNAFTPNGDGLNDIFRVYGEGFEESSFKLFIFNRWGELIFESNSMDTGWDGTHKGLASQADVYVWKIAAKGKYDGKKYEHRGHITLIR